MKTLRGFAPVRQNNDNNPLQIRLRARSIPKISPKRFYQRLIQHMTQGRPLPDSWIVEIGWRNPATKYGRTRRWQYDDFESAVSDSRAGFNDLLHDALVRRLRRLV
jgi:hypothetical protein